MVAVGAKVVVGVHVVVGATVGAPPSNSCFFRVPVRGRCSVGVVVVGGRDGAAVGENEGEDAGVVVEPIFLLFVPEDCNTNSIETTS